MNTNPEIDVWDSQLPDTLIPLASELRRRISSILPTAEGRLFHGAPVWFVNNNPLVGYSESKGALALLFWSGQSFPTPGLVAKGKHKAAEARFVHESDISQAPLDSWLREAAEIQWDYQNIRQNQGELRRLS